MAGMDYYNCDLCGRGKVFYDANVDWENFGPRIGDIVCICAECSKDHKVVVVQKSSKASTLATEDHNWGVHSWTVEHRPTPSVDGQEGKNGG